MKPIFLLIDGNHIMYRAFYAIRHLSTKDHILVNAVYGFFSMVLKMIFFLQPSHLAIAFDAGKIVFRHEQFAAYKAGRPPMPDTLRVQLEIIQNMLAEAHISFFKEKGYEADDILATLADFIVKTDNLDVFICSGDMDLFQLISQKVHFLSLGKKGREYEKITLENFKERYGMTPYQIVDYKGLRGDPSDGIPGIKGIGEKTALQLLSRYDSLDTIYDHIHEIQGSLGKKLLEGKKDAYQARSLATLVKNVNIVFESQKCEVRKMDFQAIKEAFIKYNFVSLLKRIEDVKKIYLENDKKVYFEEEVKKAIKPIQQMQLF